MRRWAGRSSTWHFRPVLGLTSGTVRVRDGGRLLHRLPGGEVVVGGQPLRVHAAARRLRGAGRADPAGPAVRHRRARWCCAGSSSRSAQPSLQSGRPGRSCSSAAILIFTAVKILRDTRHAATDHEVDVSSCGRYACCAGSCRSPRTTSGPHLIGPRGRPPRADAAGAGRRRGVRHRPGLRRRLRPRRLRRHRGPVPRLHHQRFLAARPARAVLRAAGRAGQARPPQLRARDHPRASSA